MSDAPFIVPANVDDAELSVYVFRALAHVVRRAGPDGHYYGSGTRSAALCRMSLRRWRDAIGELVQLGLLEVVGEEAGRPTVYRARPDRCTTCTSALPAPVAVQHVHGTGAPRAGGSAPNAGVPVHHVHTKESLEGVPSRSPLKERAAPPSALALSIFPKRPSRTTDNGNGAATKVRTPAPSWSAEACDDWTARFKGTAPGGRIGRALAPLVKAHGWEHVRTAWVNYLGQAEAEFASAQRFATTFGRWSGTAPAKSKTAAVLDNNRAVLARFVEGGDS